MTLTIRLSEEVELKLAQQASAEGVDVATFVEELVSQTILEACDQQTQPQLSPAEFTAQLKSIAAMHPASIGGVDDSRESIYEDGGE